MKAGIRNSSRFAVVVVLTFASCAEDEFISLSGKTMGTYYSVQYQASENYQVEIDSILEEFISAASTYDSTSELSDFNRNGFVNFRTPYLYRMLQIAKQLNAETGGAFEPTLFPLVNAHGFGPSRKNIANPFIIDSLLTLVSMNYVQFDTVRMKALKSGVQIDLNAMGEGFAIELIADFLEMHHVRNYKVEIGGELKCSGRNPNNELWLIGIEEPFIGRQTATKTVRLHNESISTSGSYKNFYKDRSGKRQSHLIDPKTGYPVQNNLVSVTLKMKSAIQADALATACMIMGLDGAIRFIEGLNLEAFITYEENGTLQTWHTPFFLTHKPQSVLYNDSK
jgi:FAD:protein FMN transferase